ncbi:MAG: hypothetical protein OXC14_12570 [Rhodospirillaceae bacterium]|nr:hypothetical protein [Rhodospirillaceae bacterium]
MAARGESRYGRTIYLPRPRDSRAIELRRRRLTTEPGGAAYDEEWLQQLLLKTPGLLPIGEIDPAFAPAIPRCRELPTDAGPIDLAYVSESGRLTLVECKLWKNPEARREVVAQILDYAKELNRWSYDDLNTAVRRARRSDPARGDLFELVQPQSESVDEADFVDSVTRNLADGRFLLLIVGDGIKEGVERIAEPLRRLAGIQFIFGLVELAMFELPAENTPGGLIVEPRILARTVEIERAIVRRADSGVVVEEPASPKGKQAVRRITVDEFYNEVGKLDAALPDRLRRFFGRVEDLGLNLTSGDTYLELSWRRLDGNVVRFGRLYASGRLDTAYIARAAEKYGDVDVGVKYLEALCDLIPNSSVKKERDTHLWRVVVNGGTPGFALALRRTDDWVDAIERTMDAFNRLAAD